jgi:peptidyl-prolyl cis-trans isomerase SurA
MTRPCTFFFRALALATLLSVSALPAQSQATSAGRSADFIVAVVNNELVTQVEVDQRMARARAQADRAKATLPPPGQLRREVIEALINERVLVTYARDSGTRVDDPELDRAVANVAGANQLSPEGLRERLKAEGVDYLRFRANLKDQILAERIREREVQARIRVLDAEVDALIAQQIAKQGGGADMNIAQILVAVPDGAADTVVAERRARAEAALARVLAGEAFDKVAKEVSDDGATRERGGELGVKPVDRFPDLFVAAVKPLSAGAVAPQVLRSGAGFHVLKLLTRNDGGTLKVTQTRARHILLRPSARLSVDAAQRQLADFRAQILSGKQGFEELARANSDDGSAASGGDLGWASPGMYVPEFEEAMNRLPLGGISSPVESRFGVHLIQVVERREVPMDPRQLREQATNILREQKYEGAYNEWISEIRALAYVEMREPPQ